MKIRYLLTAILGLLYLVVISIGLTGCGCGNGDDNDEKTPKKPTVTFKYAIGSEPKSIDPAICAESAGMQIVMNTCEGLVNIDQANLQSIPGVAESWDVSEDQTTYTFHLRQNAMWWGNGLTTPKSVTAHDFVYGWHRLLDPKTEAEYIELPRHMGIKGMEQYWSALQQKTPPATSEELQKLRESLGFRAVDDYTFEVTLVDAGRGKIFLKLIGFTPLCPVHQATIEKYGREWTQPSHFVSNGPYFITEHKLGSHFTLTKNPYYWDKNNVQIDVATAITSSDNEAMLLAYQSGDSRDTLDWLGANLTIPPARIKQWRSKPDLRSAPLYSVYFYIFNTTKPPFDNAKARLAFCHAIDRQTIVTNVTKGAETPFGSYFPPLPDYTPIKEGCEYNPSLAQQLLAEAGYPNGVGFPDINLKYNSDVRHKLIAEVIQAQWKHTLKVEVKLHPQDWPSLLADRQSQAFDVVRAGWNGDYMDTYTFAATLLSESDFNNGKWNNPEYDKLVNEALKAPTVQEAERLYQAAERIIIQEAPVCSFFVDGRLTLVKPYTKGYLDNQMGWHPLKNLRVEH